MAVFIICVTLPRPTAPQLSVFLEIKRQSLSLIDQGTWIQGPQNTKRSRKNNDRVALCTCCHSCFFLCFFLLFTLLFSYIRVKHDLFSLLKGASSRDASWPENVENVQIFSFASFVRWCYKYLCNRGRIYEQKIKLQPDSP